MNANTWGSWSPLLMLLLLLVASQQDITNGVKVDTCELAVDLLRLPTRVQPTKYKLDLELNPRGKKYSGRVEIDLDFQTGLDSEESLKSRSISRTVHPYATDPRKIILNADDLVVSDLQFHQEGLESLVESICMDAENNILVVTLDRAPNSGAARLIFDFTGRVQREPKGLFRSFSESGKPMLAANLQTSYARRLFPCFDEPEFKATFELTVRHPAGSGALSNTPPSETADNSQNDMALTRFQPTPKMSTYLLGLAVGHFRCRGKASQDGTQISICEPFGWQGDASELLNEAVNTYDRVSEFFARIPPPLVKIDIVALDVGFTATENWGLINVNHAMLSASASTSKPIDWVHVVTNLTSRMVHQRLGNLFTIRWWDDLWFKEGLAAHLANELVAKAHPEMGNKLVKLIHTNTLEMEYEDMPYRASALKSGERDTARQLEAKFSSCTKKSEALLRMFASFAGADNFESAIRRLVESDPQGGLIDAEEWLGELLNKVSGDVDWRTIIREWTEHKAYPTILVELSVSERVLLVSQAPHLANGQVWSVPIEYKFSAGHQSLVKKLILSGEPSVIKLPEWFHLKAEDNWFIFNNDYQGYYRVVYHSKLIEGALSNRNNLRQMGVANRLQLLSNYYSDAKMCGVMTRAERELKWFFGDLDDGVVLLLTKILAEMHDQNCPFALSDPVRDWMLRYYYRNDAVWGEVSSKDALTQYTRGRVVDYLVRRLKVKRIRAELAHRKREFEEVNAALPPFLQEVDEHQRPSSRRSQ